MVQAAAPLSPSYLVFSLLSVLSAAGGVGSYLVSFVLLFEWAAPEHRTRASVFAQALQNKHFGHEGSNATESYPNITHLSLPGI